MIEHQKVDYKSIGKRIKELRKKRRITQRVLASSADISVQFLSNVENANAKASLSTIVKIANALDTGVDALLCDSLNNCRPVFESHLAAILEGCAEHELRLVCAQAKGLVEELQKSNTYNKLMAGDSILD